MKLRIVSGTLKGRYVLMPDSNVKGNGFDFRPTQERVRESVAEIIKKRLRRPDCIAADVCAGSGAFGFEMLSRGASRVDFVESNAAVAAGIGENAERLGIPVGAARVVREDVRRFVDSAAVGYDVIFYDPPYGDVELAGLVPKLLGLINDGGILVYERRRQPKEKRVVDAAGGRAGMADARVYSDTVVEIYGKD